jgi:hypothetical protein
MRNSLEEELTRLGHAPTQELVAERLMSTAEVCQQGGELARAYVSIDTASASCFSLGVRVNEYELAIRPRADDGGTVAMRICEDTVYGLVEIEVPACCFVVDRGIDPARETVDFLTESLLFSEAQIRDGDGNGVCARLLGDRNSRSGLHLNVRLACGRTVIVRPHDDDGKLVAIGLRGDGEHGACNVVEVEMPKHVMAAPDLSAP